MQTVKQLLIEYGKELGTTISVEQLIEANRNLIKELNQGHRKDWKDALEEAREEAAARVMDNTWIKIDRLRKMSVAELVALLRD